MLLTSSIFNLKNQIFTSALEEPDFRFFASALGELSFLLPQIKTDQNIIWFFRILLLLATDFLGFCYIFSPISLVKNWRFTTHFHGDSSWELLWKSIRWPFRENRRPNFFFFNSDGGSQKLSSQCVLYFFFLSYSSFFIYLFWRQFLTAITMYSIFFSFLQPSTQLNSGGNSPKPASQFFFSFSKPP